MPIETSGSAVAADSVPPGIQVPFLIRGANFNPDGKFAPDIELDLTITEEKYYGTQCKYWSRIQQPRMDLVRRWRADGMSDDIIKSALRERGFKFKKIDEKDKMVVSRNGKTFEILAAISASPQAADAILAECDNFDELAKRFVDGRFIGTTKQNQNGYVGLDGREPIFPVARQPASVATSGDNADPGATDSDEDFEDIPI